MNKRWAILLTAYYCSLAAYLVAGLFPDHRVWGINWWGYFPSWVPWSLFGVGVVAPGVLRLCLRRFDSDSDEIAPAAGDRRFLLFAGIVTALSGVLFWLLRTRTHFLGDGYAYLSLLAQDIPLVKYRDLGEALAHIGLKQILGLDGESGALLTFQIISITAGIGFMLCLVGMARILYTRYVDRTLFVLFMASTGPMLLFFGYVENYSLFVLSVAMFSMCGLLVAQGKVRRGVVLPLLVVSCFLHVFGVCLIPSAVYLITSGTRFGAHIAGLNWRLKVLLTMLAVSAVAALFFRFFFSDYFFRFAVIPLVPDRFTVQGYWLLSLTHVIDFCNLLVLLVPSLLVVAAAGWSASFRKLIGRRDYRYLIVLTASVTTAAFIFDPQLGMPRDWDLFSFAGIPLALTSIYLILDSRHRPFGGARIVLLSIVLGSLALVPRVVGQAIPEIAIARFNGYAALDMTKNMYGRITLLKYYEEVGDTAAVERERERYVNDYPVRQVNHEGVRWKDRGNCARAAPFFERALQMNPMYSAAFTNLAMCCQQSGQLDSAVDLFRIAVGLSPFNATINTKLAGAYVQLGELENAAKSLKWAVKIDPDNIDPLLGLIMVYERLGRVDDRLDVLSKLAQLPDAPVGALKEMGEHHLDRQEYQKASELFQRALTRGLDSTYVRQLINTHPQLGRFIR